MTRYAIFFPQFHRVRVNDQAWGAGFTDWMLVAAANAFGHWKHRRSPACGFYDLSNHTDVGSRLEAAAAAGIGGFGIYHYRFEDGPELDAVERYLRCTPPPAGFQYFYIWANEDWSTRWRGNDKDKKIEILKRVCVRPGRREVAEHVNYLAPFMDSDAYTRIAGRPLFVVYRPDWFTDTEATLGLYREEFRRAGLHPSIGFFLHNLSDAAHSKTFDFGYLFEPRLFFNAHGLRKHAAVIQAYRALARTLSAEKTEALYRFLSRIRTGRSTSYSFAEFLAYLGGRERAALISACACPLQNIATCGWNNAPRYRRRFTELEVPTEEQMAAMMATMMPKAMTMARLAGRTGNSATVPLLCNAWNEWSEGAAIEPCSYLGDTLLRAYLHGPDGEIERRLG